VSLLDLIRIPRERFARYDLVGGHLEFGYHLPEYMGREVQVVTMLRDPRSHLLSLYKQVMQEPLDPIRKHVDAHCSTVDSFFFDPVISDYVANPQTRFLAVAERRLTVPVLDQIRRAKRADAARIVAEAAAAAPAPSAEEMLERARRRLSECLLVGLVEQFDESVNRLCVALGWPPFGRVASRCVSSIKVSRETISPRVLARIDELTKLDRVLYREAVDRFHVETPAFRRAA
jgi:hypothetical protein